MALGSAAPTTNYVVIYNPAQVRISVTKQKQSSSNTTNNNNNSTTTDCIVCFSTSMASSMVPGRSDSMNSDVCSSRLCIRTSIWSVREPLYSRVRTSSIEQILDHVGKHLVVRHRFIDKRRTASVHRCRHSAMRIEMCLGISEDRSE